ncbi:MULTISPECIES: hypothetical protein [Geomonas]|uniref:hypothetical protein n=1 Tax=Geomonas TaxID=2651583 RepID=UPI00100B15C2|nr:MULTISPECIES: hypothetical protein [Geomonas]
MVRNKTFSGRQLTNISGWLKENPGFTISSENLVSLTSLVTPSFHQRADKLLVGLEALTTYAGELLEYSDDWLSICWALNFEEFVELVEYLASIEYIDNTKSTLNIIRLKINPGGWAYLDKTRTTNMNSAQGFVAMWFAEDLQDVYLRAIDRGIRQAGYHPHRVDLSEHNKKIDDEIIAQIRRSRFVLADFTGHRGGVYYEAGFAKGLGLEVIWSCRKDNLDELHFDIRQYNCIVWEQDKLEEFAKRIQDRIEAVLGAGPHASGVKSDATGT